MATSLEILNHEYINNKIESIRPLLQDKKIIVAFSGGVDSTVAAFLSKKFSKKILLVMQIGYSVAIGEKEYAKMIADKLDLPIEFIKYDEVDLSEEYVKNPSNRCYYCKNLLHGFLTEIKEKREFDIIISGTNYSDLEGHRPGHQSAKEAGIINPLVDAKLTKQEIRWIARDAELEVWDKPASACLASRFVTGVEITKDGLQRVAQAEYYLKQQFNFKIVRVRNHGNLARIELGEKELRTIREGDTFELIGTYLKDLGYRFVTLDLQGYRPATPQ